MCSRAEFSGSGSALHPAQYSAALAARSSADILRGIQFTVTALLPNCAAATTAAETRRPKGIAQISWSTLEWPLAT